MDEVVVVQRMWDDFFEEERKGNMGKIFKYIFEFC